VHFVAEEAEKEPRKWYHPVHNNNLPSEASSFALKKPIGSLGGKFGVTAGGIKVSLNTTHKWPEQRTNSIALEKKIGSMCCKLESSAKWPAKPIASIRGTTDVKGTSMCYDLKAPVASLEGGIDGLDLSGTVSLRKEIGESLCTLESAPVWPLKPMATIQHTFKDAGSICCTVKTALDTDLSGMMDSTTATLQRTFDTDLGPICCKAKTSVMDPTKASGSVTLKKKMGGLCANLEAKTDGKVHCTLESAWTGVNALAGQPFPNFIGFPVGALIGILGGSGLTFAVFRFRRGGSPAGEYSLLAA
jgi:hypothetical protein